MLLCPIFQARITRNSLKCFDFSSVSGFLIVYLTYQPVSNSNLSVISGRVDCALQAMSAKLSQGFDWAVLQAAKE